MNRVISFAKMSGAGNDFIVIDNLDSSIDFDMPRLAVALCSRRHAVGADGLLLLEPSTKANFSMRYYNADGSFGGMCGNGGRCIARYAYARGIAPLQLKFEALDYVYEAEVDNSSVKLWMKIPSTFKPNILVALADVTLLGHFIDTGSPHFVIESTDLESTDVFRVGREIRRHPLFAPEGCNVNFVSRQVDDVLSIRTYERGVESETLACGTGSVASAIVYALQYGLKSPVTLNVRSGEQLIVYFDFERGQFRNVVLQGSAHMVFSGTLQYDPEAGFIADALTLTSADSL
jgi:diaminopimelate epimerase